MGDSDTQVMEQGWEKAETAIDNYDKSQVPKIFRFWMKSKTSTKIIFLDDLPTLFWEHQLYMNGSWKNWFTCLQATGVECPLCKMAAALNAYRASHVAAFSIIDRSEWESRTGRHKDELKLYVCKLQTLKLLKIQALKRGGLAGLEYEVHRVDDDTANVGGQFDFERKWKVDELAEAFKLERIKAADGSSMIKTLNYRELFAPKSIQELTNVANMIIAKAKTQPDSSSAPTTPAPPPADEDIPF